jgi:hypothetical protein
VKFRHFLPIALLCGVLTGVVHVRAQMWSPWVKGTGAAATASCAAATFNGTTAFGSVPLTFSSVAQFSISVWANLPSFDNADEMLMEYSVAAGGPNPGSFFLDPDSGGIPGTFESLVSGASQSTDTIPRPSAASWHNLVFAIDMLVNTGAGNAQLVGAWVDGTSQTISPHGTALTTALGNYTLYIMSRAGTSLFRSGSIERLAIWSSLLSGANATSLAGGAAPSTIAGGPRFYWALTGAAGTEANLGSGGTATVTLTNTGTGAGPSPCPTL